MPRLPAGHSSSVERARARDLIVQLLGRGGRRPAKEVIARAEAEGINTRTLRRAADDLGVLKIYEPTRATRTGHDVWCGGGCHRKEADRRSTTSPRFSARRVDPHGGPPVRH